MKKKISNCFFLLGMILLIYYPVTAAAKDPNVADCLENGDCEEEDDTNMVEQDQNSEPDSFKETGSLLFDLVKMVFALLLVLGLIYLLLKFLGRRNRLFHQVKGLENLGGISVGQNKSIQIVRIGTKLYLIGVGDNVEMLEEITDEQTKEDLLHHEETAGEPGNHLIPSLFRQKKKQDKPGDTEQGQSFQQLFARELTKLSQTRKQMIHEKAEKEDQHE